MFAFPNWSAFAPVVVIEEPLSIVSVLLALSQIPSVPTVLILAPGANVTSITVPIGLLIPIVSTPVQVTELKLGGVLLLQAAIAEDEKSVAPPTSAVADKSRNFAKLSNFPILNTNPQQMKKEHPNPW